MLQIEITDSNGATRLVTVPDDSIIGKGAQCEVRLDSWRLGKEHARLFSTPSGVLLEDMGSFGGVTVNGERIDAQYGPLRLPCTPRCTSRRRADSGVASRA